MSTDDAAAERPGYDTISFLSDFGLEDVYVGVVHSVLRQMCPAAAVVDITHSIPPFDVRSGALALARSVQYAAPGVIVAVVDPGVGTDRRAVAIEVAGGRAVLVGPDNGLLAAAAGMVGGAERAVTLDKPEYHLSTESTTFDGRDVFAPIAAHLCNGVPLEDLGTLIDAHSLMPGVLPLTRLEEGVLICEVLAVDRFGNVQLNVEPEEIEGFGDRFSVVVDASVRTVNRVRSFGEVGSGRIGALVDSDGLVALVASSSSAAEELSLAQSSEVAIRDLDDDGPGVATPVRLGERSDQPGATPDEPGATPQ